MGTISWLISLAVACAVIFLFLGSAGLICYLDEILPAEQKRKIGKIVHIILSIISIIFVLFLFTLIAHLLIFELHVK